MKRFKLGFIIFLMTSAFALNAQKIIINQSMFTSANSNSNPGRLADEQTLIPENPNDLPTGSCQTNDCPAEANGWDTWFEDMAYLTFPSETTINQLYLFDGNGSGSIFLVEYLSNSNTWITLGSSGLNDYRQWAEMNVPEGSITTTQLRFTKSDKSNSVWEIALYGEESDPVITNPTGECLTDRDAGIGADLSDLDIDYNHPSNYTYGSMLAINDGGGRFYDFNSSYFNPTNLTNPMLEITDEVRIFIQMQEDFAVSPDLSLLPADTEGVPTSMTGLAGHPSFLDNQTLLEGIKAQGFKIHACLEAISQTDGTYANSRSFPEKWYFANEWGEYNGADYTAIQTSARNYTAAFIQAMSPPNCLGNDCLVDVFEVGNEPWGFPDEKIYHAIITGAWQAFYQEYGTPDLWKMKLIAPSFQAFRENILECNNPDELNAINLQSGTDGSGNFYYNKCQYDEIGGFLDLPCEILNDLGAINIHPYGFKNGNVYTFETEPEHPQSEFNQIKNTVVWRDVNFPNSDMPIYATEFGWSSGAGYNGELGQAANYLRGILIQGRYHIAKSYIYNGYDDGDPLYNDHSISTADQNVAIYDNAVEGVKKPAFYAVKDFKNLLADKVFYKAIEEDLSTLYAYILANPDGSDPYLVFWTPTETTDSNIDIEGAYHNVDWNTVLPNYTLETTTATSFSLDGLTNGTFEAALNTNGLGFADIRAKRMPSYIRLIPDYDHCVDVCWELDGCDFTQTNNNILPCTYSITFSDITNSDQELDGNIVISYIDANGIITESYQTISFDESDLVGGYYIGGLPLELQLNPLGFHFIPHEVCIDITYEDGSVFSQCLGAIDNDWRCHFGGNKFGCPSNKEEEPKKRDLGKASLEDFVDLSKLETIIYPNPTRKELNIELNTALGKEVGIQVVDALGSLKISQSFRTDRAKVVINTSNLAVGIHFISLDYGNGKLITKKFVVKR